MLSGVGLLKALTGAVEVVTGHFFGSAGGLTECSSSYWFACETATTT